MEKLPQDVVRKMNLERYSTPERPITVLPARTPGLISEKWGVAKLPNSSPKLERNLMILGTGRCGTHNLSKLLTTIGRDVDHEIVGADGTSSHYFMADSEWYPMHVHMGILGNAHVAQRLSDYTFKNVVHLVRNPLIGISSLTEIFKPLEFEFFEDNDIIPVENRKSKKREYRGMVLWYYVNSYIGKNFPDAVRYRIEDLNSWWGELLERSNWTQVPKPNIGATNKSSWRSQSHLMTTDEIYAIDPNLALKIFDLAKSYGYNLFS